MKDYELEEILWRAVEARIGIEVRTSNVEALKFGLYETRAKARKNGNEAFDNLAMLTPPTNADEYLWIVKQAPLKKKEQVTLTDEDLNELLNRER